MRGANGILRKKGGGIGGKGMGALRMDSVHESTGLGESHDKGGR